MNQLELKIVAYNPTMDETKFCADVCVLTDGDCWKRIYCGRGGLDRLRAIQEANVFILMNGYHIDDPQVDWDDQQLKYIQHLKETTNGAN